MGITRRVLVVSAACAFALTASSSAYGALTTAEQKCLDGYNNKLRLVSQQAGKSARSCIKNAGKGKEANPDNCITANTDGKIAGKEAKVADLYALGKCTGAEPIQQGAATGNAAHRGAITDLAHAIFGDPVTNSGVVSPGKDTAKCQDKGIQRPTQAFTEYVKNHRKCKKDKMKAGTVTDSTSLAAQCTTLAQVDPGGKVAKKLAKVSSDVIANCTGTEFNGCTGTPAQVGDCLEALSLCYACTAINDADGTDMDCDLLDDGAANGSCGIPEHKCVLDTSPTTDSQIQIHIAALPVPLTFGMSGALDIGAAGAIATCDIQMINPINIPSIGFVCISPAGGCAPGSRACAGGPALGIDIQSDGNAGACTSNAQCTSIATCPVGYTLLGDGACTGYCSGPTHEACTNDADCSGNGACNGPDPVGSNNNICQISCIDTTAHGASGAGAMQCQLGSDLVVESAAPCNGTDTTIDVGQTCIPVSTQRASSIVNDANFNPGSTVPPPPNVNDQLGVSIPCATVDASTVTGLRGVGAVNFFGSALGDLAVGLKATCQ
jgi:hypothetical protein